MIIAFTTQSMFFSHNIASKKLAKLYALSYIKQ